jgi:alkylation response protein AidB-like acyl-CoA dehydrogenase
MHCVGTAVIAAKATADHEERYLRPIAQGGHITTLALSESGTGGHFYLARTRLRAEGDDYLVDGAKQFVTNGRHADSYVVSTVASSANEAGDFSCLVIDRDTPGMTWCEPWQGFGMEKARALLHGAARLGDLGDPAALPYLLSCKAQAAETAVKVTNEAMTLGGGIAYRENSLLARLLRDARAGHVMAPATDLLKTRTGRSLLGLPIL